MKRIFEFSLLFLFLWVIPAAGNDVLVDSGSIFISLGIDGFYFPGRDLVYVNIPGYDHVGVLRRNSRTIHIGDRTLQLKHEVVILNGQPFMSYDDYLGLFSRLPVISNFYVVKPYDFKGYCCVERYVANLDYLKPLASRNSPIVVVIDPGHGGEDSGAVGPWCHMEKDLVLQIAGLVAEMLGKETDYRIILTRYGDYYVPLKDRSRLANEENASVFISIHANAAPRPTAEGVETFLLALNPKDEEAKHVAALENKWAEVTGEFKSERKIKRIVNDLLQNQITIKSALLARTIQTNLIRSTGGYNRGIRKANFWVLLGTKMPSTLVEVGFISNAVEEIRLFDLSYQKKIARAISDGIIDFLKHGSGKYETRR